MSSNDPNEGNNPYAAPQYGQYDPAAQPEQPQYGQYAPPLPPETQAVPGYAATPPAYDPNAYNPQGQYGQQAPQDPYAQQQGYNQPYAAAPYQGGYAPAVAPTNVLAIIALIAAFVVAPAGIICGHIAMRQIARTGEQGRGLALAGTILGYVFTGFIVLYIVGVIVFIAIAGSAAAASSSFSSY